MHSCEGPARPSLHSLLPRRSLAGRALPSALEAEDEDCTARRAVLCLFLGLPLSCVALPEGQFEEQINCAASRLDAAPEQATFARLRSLPREGHEALLPLLASAIMG